MKFIIGIGNPGKEYEQTRHNIGFAVLDALRRSQPAGSGTVRWESDQVLKALVSEFEPDVYLAKPTTFVNQTGETAAAVQGKYGLGYQDLLVVCDDANMEFGKLRLRDSGRAGGHHGLQSVIAALNSEKFPRLRVGVRSAATPKELTGFILGNLDAVEQGKMGGVLEKASRICASWAHEGFEAAAEQLSRLQSIV